VQKLAKMRSMNLNIFECHMLGHLLNTLSYHAIHWEVTIDQQPGVYQPDSKNLMKKETGGSQWNNMVLMTSW